LSRGDEFAAFADIVDIVDGITLSSFEAGTEENGQRLRASTSSGKWPRKVESPRLITAVVG
jgi:hypothetical protein